jgi:hypothetical protein
MNKPELLYNHWRTGEPRVYLLNQERGNSPERVSSLTCPFDSTPLIFAGGEGRLFCANCGEAYPSGSKQENLVSVWAVRFSHFKFKASSGLQEKIEG